MDPINTFLNNTMKSFDQLMLNPYFATILTIILTVYAALASPKLPNFLKKLFDNTIFKIIIISFIAYRANKNPQLSILIAICFVITLNYLAEKETKETFEQIERFNQLEYFSNALDVDGDIEPILPEQVLSEQVLPEQVLSEQNKINNNLENYIDDNSCPYSKI